MGFCEPLTGIAPLEARKWRGLCKPRAKFMLTSPDVTFRRRLLLLHLLLHLLPLLLLLHLLLLHLRRRRCRNSEGGNNANQHFCMLIRASRWFSQV